MNHHSLMRVLIIEKRRSFYVLLVMLPLQEIKQLKRIRGVLMRGDMFYIGEITLYDSVRLLTPVGIQDSYFGRLYTENYYKLKTNKQKLYVS